MRTPRLALLAATAIVLVSGACSSSGGDATDSTTTTAPAATTSTASTVATTTTAATTTTGPTTTLAAATTTAPATTVAPTTSSAGPAATTPEAAAQGLYAAWKAGDQAAAAAFGDPGAVSKIFENRYTGPDLQFLGCEADGSVYSCTYYYEGGARTFRTSGSATAGYKVNEITDLAD